MNSTRNRTIPALLASSALVVGLAACGSPTETAKVSIAPEATTTSEPVATPTPSSETPTPSPAPTPALEPSTLVVQCGAPITGDYDWVDAKFGYHWQAYEPFKVKIDYGDGHTYVNDSAHLDQVFKHRYKKPGQHTVTATLMKDAEGFTAQSSCTWEWNVPSYLDDLNSDSGGCYYDPTLNYDWHDDYVCGGVRQYFREWDHFVTREELDYEARKWERRNN